MNSHHKGLSKSYFSQIGSVESEIPMISHFDSFGIVRHRLSRELTLLIKRDSPKVILCKSVQSFQSYGRFCTNVPEEGHKEEVEDLEFSLIDRHGAPVKVESFYQTFPVTKGFLLKWHK